MFFPLHISSSRVEISLHTEFELPRPAGTTILVVIPILIIASLAPAGAELGLRLRLTKRVKKHL